MINIIARAASLLAIVLVVAGIGSRPANATHDDFRFKWPYLPGASSGTTGYPYTAHHSGANAWDFDINLNDVGDTIVSASEGTVSLVTSGYDPNSCNPADGNGFGNHVKVVTDMPSGQSDITTTYAHLASTAVSANSRALQGDMLGIEGKTGHTEGSEGPSSCGTHLHFQFDPARPSYIDGDFVGGSGPSSTDGGPSSSFVVGAYNTPGAAIRELYKDVAAFLGSGWAWIGWTTDQVGYAPDPATGHWGSTQVYRLHPGTPVASDTMIGVGRWAQSVGYFVEQGFYGRWVGALFFGEKLGLPIKGAGSCPPDSLSSCVRYQQFNFGFVWKNSSGAYNHRVCPSVAPAYPNEDYVVDLLNDIFAVALAVGQEDTSAPHQAWLYAQYDLDGNGSIDLFNDVFGVAFEFGAECWPGGVDP
ncbi:MAG: M23 family metallopeptidase [Dehalococcoidia bacterium]